MTMDRGKLWKWGRSYQEELRAGRSALRRSQRSGSDDGSHTHTPTAYSFVRHVPVDGSVSIPRHLEKISRFVSCAIRWHGSEL